MSERKRAAKGGHGNDDYAWAKFDPDAYVAHYYADPHPDDDRVVRLTCRALSRAGRGLDVIDVGTGSNLFPLFAALPIARSVTAYEYGDKNIAWLKRELSGGMLRGPWPHFWRVAQRAHGRFFGSHPIRALARRADIVQGSIFSLPERGWDAATMFFCAESITQRQDEFSQACASLAGCVKPGGTIAAAFLAGSRGYRVGEQDFPAVSITPARLRETFRPLAHNISITRIGDRSAEIRSGYSGMYFLTAQVR